MASNWKENLPQDLDFLIPTQPRPSKRWKPTVKSKQTLDPNSTDKQLNFRLPENSTQENSTQENSTQKTQHKKTQHTKTQHRKLNTF